MLLGGVFKATGNASPVTVPAKGRWMNDDIARWAALRRAVRVQSAFPDQHADDDARRDRPADAPARRVPALPRRRRAGDVGAPKNLGDPAVLAATLADAGFDAGEITALVADPEVKARLVATTEEAVARGVFGAPTSSSAARCTSARTGSSSCARRCSPHPEASSLRGRCAASRSRGRERRRASCASS